MPTKITGELIWVTDGNEEEKHHAHDLGGREVREDGVYQEIRWLTNLGIVWVHAGRVKGRIEKTKRKTTQRLSEDAMTSPPPKSPSKRARLSPSPMNTRSPSQRHGRLVSLSTKDRSVQRNAKRKVDACKPNYRPEVSADEEDGDDGDCRLIASITPRRQRASRADPTGNAAENVSAPVIPGFSRCTNLSSHGKPQPIDLCSDEDMVQPQQDDSRAVAGFVLHKSSDSDSLLSVCTQAPLPETLRDDSDKKPACTKGQRQKKTARKQVLSERRNNSSSSHVSLPQEVPGCSNFARLPPLDLPTTVRVRKYSPRLAAKRPPSTSKLLGLAILEHNAPAADSAQALLGKARTEKCNRREEVIDLLTCSSDEASLSVESENVATAVVPRRRIRVATNFFRPSEECQEEKITQRGSSPKSTPVLEDRCTPRDVNSKRNTDRKRKFKPSLTTNRPQERRWTANSSRNAGRYYPFIFDPQCYC